MTSHQHIYRKLEDALKLYTEKERELPIREALETMQAQLAAVEGALLRESQWETINFLVAMGGLLVALLDKHANWSTIFPDWAFAPSWAQWWAVDENGIGYWYSVKPHIDGDQWKYKGGGQHKPHQRVELDGNDWKDTLDERPRP